MPRGCTEAIARDRNETYSEESTYVEAYTRCPPAHHHLVLFVFSFFCLFPLLSLVPVPLVSHKRRVGSMVET